MKKDIIGLEYTLVFTVTPEMAAILDSITIHPVCSTVTMVYFAEVAARKVIEPLFEHSDQAIGGGITLYHRQMAAIGESVAMKARIHSFDGKVLLCEFEATVHTTDIILCNGTQTQILLDQSTVDDLIHKAYQRISL
ncbi:MAG: thioesterase family protein [Ignavibacteria bacterium]